MDMNYGNKYDRNWTAVVVPYKVGTFEVDYEAYRKLIRYFLQPKFVDAGGAIIVNPEAGEVSYLDSEEKKNIIKIALEEVDGKVPVFSGVSHVTTAGTVKEAVVAKELGIEGLFFLPPMGTGDITYAWNPELYPEVWVDMLEAITNAVDLPIIVHPTASQNPKWGIGIPAGPAVQICEAIPNIVGWKMTYNYLGYKPMVRALRSLDRHVAVLAAGGGMYHFAMLNEYMDGTVNGGHCFVMEPMIDHIQAWKRNDLLEARRIWNSGLEGIHDYVYSDYSRLHVRYKVGAWLRGLLPTPFMKPPQPKPKIEECQAMTRLLKNLDLDVISDKEIAKVTATL